MKKGKLIAVGIGAVVLASILTFSVWAAAKLPAKKIIEIAKADMGSTLDKFTAIYDDGNVICNSHAGANPKLANRDYQAVYFVQKKDDLPPGFDRIGGDFCVFVDRNTGEVIAGVGGQ